jgi:hypothetical protein
MLNWITGGRVFQGRPTNPLEQVVGDLRRKAANPENWDGFSDAYEGILIWIQTLARVSGSQALTGAGAVGNLGKTVVEATKE